MNTDFQSQFPPLLENPCAIQCSVSLSEASVQPCLGPPNAALGGSRPSKCRSDATIGFLVGSGKPSQGATWGSCSNHPGAEPVEKPPEPGHPVIWPTEICRRHSPAFRSSVFFSSQAFGLDHRPKNPLLPSSFSPPTPQPQPVRTAWNVPGLHIPSVDSLIFFANPPDELARPLLCYAGASFR